MLTSKERNFLRGLGNELSPVVIVGKNGVTDTVLEQLDQVLATRELVKCRVLPHTDLETGEVAKSLAEASGGEVVQVIGRNMLIYRRPEPGKASFLPWSTEG